jgi:hypothetical protein
MTGTGDGGTPFCRTTVDPNISGSLRTLDSAIADACQLTATTSDVVTIDRGSTYTYLSIYNVDVATVYVYDKNGAWVATLRWGANLPGGCQWICTAGPADFDQSQVAGPIESAFVDCSGATGDGGVD